MYKVSNALKIFSFLLLFFFIGLTSENLFSETQTTKLPIKIGISADLTGPVKLSGINIKNGVQLYFDRINAEGGIDGRKLELIVTDDKYDPVLAGSNVRQMIEKDNVLALIDNTATATAAVTVPIVNEMKTLFFAPSTGGDVVRKVPPDRYVINFRAGYKDETALIVDALLKNGIKPEEIAIVTQKDTYGDAVYNGVLNSLKKAGYSATDKIPYGYYDRTSGNVLQALAMIVDQAKIPPRVIILGGVWQTNAKFINLAHKQFPNTVYFVMSALILPEDLDKGLNNKVFTTSVVPSPADSQLPAVVEYREDIKKFMPGMQLNDYSLEGYLSAKLFVLGLQRAVKENKLTREGIIDVFESMRNVDIGIDTKISFDKNNHQALYILWPKVFKDGKFVALGNWSDLKTLIPK